MNVIVVMIVLYDPLPAVDLESIAVKMPVIGLTGVEFQPFENMVGNEV